MIVNITLPDTSYDITIDKLKTLTINKKVVIVTNPTISKLHLEYLLSNLNIKDLSVVTIPDGEQYKHMQTIEDILEHCFEHKLNRSSVLIAFGGGVIGDMTGFAASIYQRGIDFIQIPTTLLSQVDASVGGKTGVNNKFGKNLVGAFHQPQAVFIDPYFLSTLPQREVSAGIAEIIKMAVCFNKDFFEWLENNDLRDDENIKIAIQKSVETKAWVVSQDEKEKGLRAALNYGHTFGHVIENETNYNTYLHGEAVGIGICMANDASVKIGIMTQAESDRVKNLLQQYDIPTTYKIKDVKDFYEHFFLDKKSLDNKIKFILAEGLGNCKITDEISKEDIISVLETF
jgi:3-dehydroquinate synthase